MELDAVLAEFAEKRTIPIFGIAAAGGFARALPGWHPKDLMPNCQSVLVFGHPLFVHPLEMEPRTYIANLSWWEVQRIVSRQLALWKGELFALLDDLGVGVASFGRFKYTAQPTFSYRLAQVEAGVAVWGRAGGNINPDYGSYFRVGVLLTEAQLTPTDGARLEGFAPCDGCSACADACPIRAIDEAAEPGAGYDRERCARFIFAMSERSGTGAKICCQCVTVCPWSMGRLGAASGQHRHQN